MTLEEMNLPYYFCQRHLNFDFSQENAFEVFKVTQFQAPEEFPTIRVADMKFEDEPDYYGILLQVEDGKTGEMADVEYQLSKQPTFDIGGLPAITEVFAAFTASDQKTFNRLVSAFPTFVRAVNEGDTLKLSVAGEAYTRRYKKIAAAEASAMADAAVDKVLDNLAALPEIPEGGWNEVELMYHMDTNGFFSPLSELVNTTDDYHINVEIKTAFRPSMLDFLIKVTINEHEMLLPIKEPTLIKAVPENNFTLLSKANLSMESIFSGETLVERDNVIFLDKAEVVDGYVVTHPVQNGNTAAPIYVNYGDEVIICTVVRREVFPDLSANLNAAYVGVGKDFTLIIPAISASPTITPDKGPMSGLVSLALEEEVDYAVYAHLFPGYCDHYFSDNKLYVQCHIDHGEPVYYVVEVSEPSAPLDIDLSEAKPLIDFKYLATADYENYPVLTLVKSEDKLCPLYVTPAWDAAFSLSEYILSIMDQPTLVEMAINSYWMSKFNNDPLVFSETFREAVLSFGFHELMKERTGSVLDGIFLTDLDLETDEEGRYAKLIMRTHKNGGLMHCVELLKLYV